jgi:hypothetical protein
MLSGSSGEIAEKLYRILIDEGVLQTKMFEGPRS